MILLRATNLHLLGECMHGKLCSVTLFKKLDEEVKNSSKSCSSSFKVHLVRNDDFRVTHNNILMIDLIYYWTVGLQTSPQLSRLFFFFSRTVLNHHPLLETAIEKLELFILSHDLHQLVCVFIFLRPQFMIF